MSKELKSTADGLPEDGGLSLVGTEGGPVIIMPVSTVASWRGCYDDDGNHATSGSDYDRVTTDLSGEQWYEIVPVGEDHALVCTKHNSPTFWPTAEGGLIVQWVAADTDTGLIAAAIHPDQEWQTLKTHWTVTSSPLAMFDAAHDGRKGLDKCWPEPLTFELEPGTYAMAQMYWDGDIFIDGTKDEVMVRALRLTRI